MIVNHFFFIRSDKINICELEFTWGVFSFFSVYFSFLLNYILYF